MLAECDEGLKRTQLGWAADAKVLLSYVVLADSTCNLGSFMLLSWEGIAVSKPFEILLQLP